MSVEKVSFVDLNQNDDGPETPKTGDNAPLMLWILLAAGSCAAIFLILKRKAHS